MQQNVSPSTPLLRPHEKCALCPGPQVRPLPPGPPDQTLSLSPLDHPLSPPALLMLMLRFQVRKKVRGQGSFRGHSPGPQVQPEVRGPRQGHAQVDQRSRQQRGRRCRQGHFKLKRKVFSGGSDQSS